MSHNFIFSNQSQFTIPNVTPQYTLTPWKPYNQEGIVEEESKQISVTYEIHCCVENRVWRLKKNANIACSEQ
jgi:hypothetical protein